DPAALETARPIFAWLKDHQEYYVGQVPAARVLLLRDRSPEAAHRGVFRLLSEQHLPFGVVDNVGWVGERAVGLVIRAGEAAEGGAWSRGSARAGACSSPPPPHRNSQWRRRRRCGRPPTGPISACATGRCSPPSVAPTSSSCTGSTGS